MAPRPRGKREVDPAHELHENLPLGTGTIGPLRIEADRAFSARSRLLVRGLDVETEKEKVSLTLDRDLIEAIRTSAGPKRLSATVNELLMQAIERVQLRALVDSLEEEKGTASAEVYQELLNEWFGQDK